MRVLRTGDVGAPRKQRRFALLGLALAVAAELLGTPSGHAESKVARVDLLLERRSAEARTIFSAAEAAGAADVGELLEAAVVADGREDWEAALAAWAQASQTLRQRDALHSSRPIRLAAGKAEQERRASLRLLELLGRERFPRQVAHGEQQSDEDPRLEAGRLLRRKGELVIVSGHPPPAALVQHARILLLEVSITSPTAAGTIDAAMAALERCALEAAVADRERARRVLARIPRATRELPSLASSMAACRAALGEKREAIRHLIVGFGELPPPGDDDDHALGTTTWRELYLLDDWNALRGETAFEALFDGVGPAAETKN